MSSVTEAFGVDNGLRNRHLIFRSSMFQGSGCYNQHDGIPDIPVDRAMLRDSVRRGRADVSTLYWRVNL